MVANEGECADCGDAVQGERWKLIRCGSVKLFDLKNDPGETSDVLSKNPTVAAKLERVLEDFNARERELAKAFRKGAPAQLSGEALEQLRSLGYLK